MPVDMIELYRLERLIKKRLQHAERGKTNSRYLEVRARNEGKSLALRSVLTHLQRAMEIEAKGTR